MTIEHAAPAHDERPQDEPVTPIGFDLPTTVLAATHRSPEEFTIELRRAAALYWYERSEITFSTAAAIAGMSYRGFMRFRKDLGRDTFLIDWDDFDQELAELERRRLVDGGDG